MSHPKKNFSFIDTPKKFTDFTDLTDFIDHLWEISKISGEDCQVFLIGHLTLQTTDRSKGDVDASSR